MARNFVFRVFKPKEVDFAANFLYMVWIKSYLRVNTNVEISCLNWNNLGTINCSTIEFYGSEISVDKVSAPPREDKRNHSFLVTLPSV